MHFLSGMSFTAVFMSSKYYLGCCPLLFFWELVSGEMVRLSMHVVHVQCHKCKIAMFTMSIFWQQWRLTHMGDAHFGPNRLAMQWPSFIPHLTFPFLYCYTNPLTGSHGLR